MKTYLYPQNLKATANIWLWSLRDFVILLITALLAVVALVNGMGVVPLVFVVLWGFVTIRLEDTTVLDYLRYAVKFFIGTQQIFFWRQ